MADGQIMSSTLQIIALTVSMLGLWIGLWRLPSWCFRSLHRHRLWRERDEIADDILSARLPRGHAAVQELLAVAEYSARHGHELSVMDLYMWRTIGRRCDTSALAALELPLAGLSDPERKLLLHHRERISLLATSATLLGSWIGIVAILTFVLPAIREVRSRRRQLVTTMGQTRVSGVEPIRATLVEATTEAARSPMGRAVREFINLQDGIVGSSATGVTVSNGVHASA